jgi:hypothetical protein
MAWLLFGNHSSGDLLHITEARRGEACDCSCPYCGGRLLARKGDKMIYHFAHKEETCAMGRRYDFFAVTTHEYSARVRDLVEWAAWKVEDIKNTEIRLRETLTRLTQMRQEGSQIVEQALTTLNAISQPAAGRKERSKVRQTNFEVLKELDDWYYREVPKAPFPDFGAVRYPDAAKAQQELGKPAYVRVYESLDPEDKRRVAHFETGYWAGTLWEYEKGLRDAGRGEFIPYFLKDAYNYLYNHHRVIRAELPDTQEELTNFLSDKARFEKFRLYFLEIVPADGLVLHKVGITSRENIADRIAEIDYSLRKALPHWAPFKIRPLYQIRGYAMLESFFKHRYRTYQYQVKNMTELYKFPEYVLDPIIKSLHTLWVSTAEHRERIKLGQQRAVAEGKAIGRPAKKESEENFLKKPKVVQILRLLETGLKLREIERQTKYSMVLIRKVNDLHKSSRT